MSVRQAALGPAVVAQARCTHPLVAQDGTACESGRFHGLEAAAEPCGLPLPPTPAWADELGIDAHGLATVRAAVTRHGARAGLSPGRIEDLVLAVNELATNSVAHGGGRGMLRVWRADDGALTCDVRDDGTLEDPLAGRRRPSDDEIGRYGLWLVNQLCDLVEQRTLPGGGNVVRVTMRAGGTAP